MQSVQNFQDLLKRLFQSETSDLDFGIYRILNYKRDRIEKFIQEDLKNKVESAFAKHKDERLTNINQRFEEVKGKIVQSLGATAFTSIGELKEEFRDTPLGKDFLSVKTQKDEAETIDEIKLQVFNDLYNFFYRFYEEGDFVPQYRYSIKQHKYAIPFNGEEVKLYWVNNDQYYTKTGLLFRDYTFQINSPSLKGWQSEIDGVVSPPLKGWQEFPSVEGQGCLPDGVVSPLIEGQGVFKIIFRIVSAKEELGSNKATKERFFILDDEKPIEKIPSPLVGEGKGEGDNKALIIRFQYRELTDKEVKHYEVEGGSNVTKQEKINQKSYDEVLNSPLIEGLGVFIKSVLTKDYKHTPSLRDTPLKEGNTPSLRDTPLKEGRPLLLYHISRFTAKNTKDYFIHKNLKRFLSEQLDYFIKAEVLDIETLEKERFLDKHITRAKVVREIGEDIIDFLSQIEDFQKKLWEKRKFVLKTEYVITLDRIKKWTDEEFYREVILEVLKNEKQLKEWKELGLNSPSLKGCQKFPSVEGQGCLPDGVVSPSLKGCQEFPSIEGQGCLPKRVVKWNELPFNPNLKEKAKELRKAGNLAEVLLWNQVKNKQFLGLDFDRQKIIGNYIVDFYCKNLGLVVEIDGITHDEKVEYDEERDKYLESLGLKVIHIKDEDVKKNLDGVMKFLRNEMENTPDPSQRGENTPSLRDTPLKEGNTPSLRDTPLKEGNTPSAFPFAKGVANRRFDGVFADTPLKEGNTPSLRDTPLREGNTPSLRDTPLREGNTPSLRDTPLLEGNYPIDTRYFGEEFKEKLLEKLTENADLDDLLDGLLVKSENFQALNLLLARYKEKVQTIYIDPPFNKETDADYLYNVKYKDSTWISLLENRLRLARDLLSERGSIFVRCDYNGNWLVRPLMNEIFGDGNFRNEIVVKRGAPKAGLFGQFGQLKSIGVMYDNLYLFSKNPQAKWMGFLKQLGERQQGYWTSFKKIYDRPTMRYEILGVNLTEGQWMWNKERAFKAVENYKKYLEESKTTGEALEEYWIRTGIKEFVRKHNDTIQYWVAPKEVVLLDNNWLDIPGYSSSWGFKTENSEILLKRVIESTSNTPSLSDTPLKEGNTPSLSDTPLKEGNRDIVMDFFLGSGTTTAVAHKLKRKWIGVEMGEHFWSVVLPRMKKVLAYDKSGISKELKTPRQTSSDTPLKEGNYYVGGGFFKYQILEQYEDTLDNIELKENKQAELKFGDDYLLKYFLDYETRGNSSLLNIDQLKNPFYYKLRVNLEEVGEPQEVVVDIPETFNYLLGLKVKKIKVKNNQRKYLFVLGEKQGKDIAIVWREYEHPVPSGHPSTRGDWSDDDFKKDKEFIIKELEPWAPHIVYVNGQSVLTPKIGGNTVEIRYIEPEFKRLMEA